MKVEVKGDQEAIVEVIKNQLVKIRKSNFKIIDWFYDI